MSHYIPDLKYEKALEVINNLSDTDERDQLIKYYISENKKWADKAQEHIKEYQEVFDGIKPFMR